MVLELRYRNWYDIIALLPPLDWYRKGVHLKEMLSSIILSVLASVVAYYLCKWLDGDE